MVERAFKKLFLDAMVVQQGRLSDKHKSASKVYVFAYLLYVSCDMCPHILVASLTSTSPPLKVYVSAYLILLYMCAHTALLVYRGAP